MIREDITVDEFIDVLLGTYVPYEAHLCHNLMDYKGTRKYIPCLYVYNKIDSISLELMDELAHQDHTLVISCEMNLKYVDASLSR